MEYEPDDAGLTVAGLEYLEGNAALMAAAEEIGEVTPAEITRLRKQWPAEMVRMALVVAEARRKAKRGGKFEGVKNLWASPESVEQATNTLVAKHKARRIGVYLDLRGSHVDGVTDVCAGVGGDTVELDKVASVTAMEMSPVRAWCLERNCRGDVTKVRVDCIKVDEQLTGFLNSAAYIGGVFHCDPSRRTGGARRHLWSDMIPGPGVLEALVKKFRAGAIKLSPAVDFSSLPKGELELISVGGSVVQAILWVGKIAERQRVATVFRDDAMAEVFGTPDEFAGEVVLPREFIYEVDGAVHRAGLAGVLAKEFDLQPITGDGGYATGKRAEHPALARFEHVETMAFDEKKILEALRNLPTIDRAVEIKTRGGLEIDTDALQVKLSKAAPCGATVMIYRGNTGGVAASICRRAT